MEIKNIDSKLVKPSTPTSSTHRNYNISFFDEQMPNINTRLILYYSTSQKDNISNHLETSLANALTDFYPLAGRYMCHTSLIDCSDQGALYVQAKANFQLSEFLGLNWEWKSSMLDDLFPCGIGEAGEVDDPTLSVKVTTFECGGVAIGMCFSHKFADMSTICTFINNWATRSQGVDNELELRKYSPIFSVADHFPERGRVDLSPSMPRSSIGMNFSMRVFTFKGNTISQIREKLTFKDDKKHRPSKVQIVVALIWKALVGIGKANNQQPEISCVSQLVNLRGRVVPKLPDNSCGNFISFAHAQLEAREEDETDLEGFVNLLYESIKKLDNDYDKVVKPSEEVYEVLTKPFLEYYHRRIKNDVNLCVFTSWCKFSFYQADFGWGKPVWKSTKFSSQTGVIMMDDQEGDGVEAWVSLDEERMFKLAQDANIKAYAT